MGGQVYGKTNPVPVTLDFGRLLYGFLKYHVVDGMDEAGLFRCRDKEIGCKNASIIVQHAQKNLIVVDRSIRDMHDGLEMEQELFVQQRMLDLFLPVHQRVHALPRLLLVGEEMPAAASSFLGL